MILTRDNNKEVKEDDVIIIRNSTITETGDVIITNELGKIQVYRKKQEGAFDLEMGEDSDDPDAQNGGSIKMQKKPKKGFKPF